MTNFEKISNYCMFELKIKGTAKSDSTLVTKLHCAIRFITLLFLSEVNGMVGLSVIKTGDSALLITCMMAWLLLVSYGILLLMMFTIKVQHVYDKTI